MGSKSNGFAGGAAAGGTGGLCGLLNCCGSKERLAKRFWPFDCLIMFWVYSSQIAKFNFNTTSEAKKYH